MATSRRSPFGQLLRRLRLAAGLSQEDLAERAGLSVRGISSLESGQRTAPRLETVRMLADALALGDDERATLLVTARPEIASIGSDIALESAPAPTRSALPLAPLPVPPTRLVGREADVARVFALLGRDDVRLVTLTGPGGVGKTRLALAVAETVRSGFVDGVAFVDLAPLRQSELVVSTIAAGLGLRESGDESLVRLILAELRERSLLLVLDNFEQVLPAAPLVAELLAAVPGLKVLTTSRERLHLRGERKVPIGPLTLPAPMERGRPVLLEGLAGVAAVQLFVERAEEAKFDFALTAENATAVAELCRRLDGLPLAIELAAARVRMLTPAALLARLAPRLPELTDGPRDLPDRQRTLRAAIDWSHDLLSLDEQALYRRLAVFAGGWDLVAAGEVNWRIGDAGRQVREPQLASVHPESPGQLPASVFAGLGSLMDKSLIQQSVGGAAGRDGEPRFRMLETIREYALERLAASGEEDRVRQAHGAHYMALVEEAWPHLVGPEQARWFDRLEDEHDNLRAILGWALRDGDGELGLRLAGRLWWFWSIRGYLSEGRAWLGQLLEADRGAPPAVRAQALHGAGGLAGDVGDWASAAHFFEGALELRRRLGDKRGIAATAGNFGNAARMLGDRDRARQLFDESRTLYEELGDGRGVSTALTNLGSVAGDQGDFAAAAAYHEASLDRSREVGDTRSMVVALSNAGLMAILLGDGERAGSLNAECLALARDLGDRRNVATALHNLGIVAYEQGDLTRAAALFTEALDLRRELDEEIAAAENLGALGTIARDHGDHDEARARLAESLDIYRQAGNSRGVAGIIDELAVLALQLDESERAVRLFVAADALRQANRLVPPWSPADRAARRKALDAARARLGEGAYLLAWEGGQEMALDQAVAEALSPIRPTSARAQQNSSGATTAERMHTSQTDEPRPVADGDRRPSPARPPGRRGGNADGAGW
jgi:predicted ATPase/transcriptional regulator with XRE-family HTH domain